MIEIQLKERDYFLPEDGPAARQEFLNLLNGNYVEIWIAAFGFTLQSMFDAIKAADARGVKCHILIDHSQSTGRAEAPKIQDLAKSLKNGDVAITTAGVSSGKPSQIWHWKGLVAKFNDGNDALDRFGAVSANDDNDVFFCWEGSTNFSESAWDQGNSARIFSNAEWADCFIQQLEAHRAWAKENEPQYQLQ